MEFSSYKSPDKQLQRTRKINFLFLLLLGIFVVILVKLVNIQILDSEKYKIAARKQYENKITLMPYRGLIFDRNMNVLVSNSFDYSFAADPNMIEEPERIAEIFAGVFGKSKDEYLAKLTSTNTSFVYLEKKVEVSKCAGLDTLDLSGLIVLKEPKRVYNYGKLASQILGFTNIENKGQTGIELSMESELAGKEGFVIMQRDGRGNNRPSVEFPRKDAENGKNVILSIDMNMQKIAEEELEAGVKSYNADCGKVIVQHVRTGEILAMSSYPTFDPNSITVSDTAGMKNSVIADVYEPGSTFKLITAAASIEENLEDRSSIISTENMNEIKGHNITDVHGSSSMTFQQAIEQSSNIGFGKISLKLGAERFYKYARDFGFGIYSGIELPSENKGVLKRPVEFSGTSLPYMAIGYEVLINALQLSNAYSTIANDGLMMKPYIIKKVSGADGNLIFENKPVALRQVVSQKTARTLTSLLMGVVEKGTGTDAKVEGVSVAGKTGTSQRLVDGAYSSSSHNATFVGYFPAEDPKLIVTVVLNNPKSGEYYGGKVAAPVFQKIASRIVDFSGVSDIVNVNFTHHTVENTLTDLSLQSTLIPNVVNLRLEDAITVLMENNISYEVMNEALSNNGKGTKLFVESQFPSPNERVIIGEELKVRLQVRNSRDTDERLNVVPEVKLMSLRKAINVLLNEGFEFEINGSGKIIDQYPKPGSKQISGSKVILYCENQQ